MPVKDPLATDAGTRSPSKPTVVSLVTAAVLVAVALAVWLFWPSGECDAHFDGSMALVCGHDNQPLADDVPVDLLVMLDLTVARGDQDVVDAQLTSVTQAAAVVVSHGGTIAVKGFGRSAPAAKRIIRIEVPTLSQLRSSRRDAMSSQVNAKLRSALLDALRTPVVDSGSDVSGAVGELGSGDHTPGAVSAATLVGDGWDYAPGAFNLATELRERPAKAARRLADRLVKPNPMPDAVAIVGLGRVGGHSATVDIALVRALERAWAQACSSAIARDCLVTSSSS